MGSGGRCRPSVQVVARVSGSRIRLHESKNSGTAFDEDIEELGQEAWSPKVCRFLEHLLRMVIGGATLVRILPLLPVRTRRSRNLGNRVASEERRVQPSAQRRRE